MQMTKLCINPYLHGMKKILSLIIICLIIAGCSKKAGVQNESGFTKYAIPKGQHSSDENRFISIEYSELKFVAKFDSRMRLRNGNLNIQSVF